MLLPLPAFFLSGSSKCRDCNELLHSACLLKNVCGKGDALRMLEGRYRKEGCEEE